MPECLEKVKDLRTRFPGKNIQVDGGVGAGNACQCAQAGEYSMASHLMETCDTISSLPSTPADPRIKRSGGRNSHLRRQRSQTDDIRDAHGRR
jgi:hypothetical protein